MKIRYICLLFSLIVFNVQAYASNADIFGYFEPQLAVFSNGDTYQLSSNKLRMDLKGRFSDQVSFGANVNFLQYLGKTEWDLLDYIPDSLKGSIPESQEGAYNMAYENDILLDNAYIKMSFEYMDLTL